MYNLLNYDRYEKGFSEKTYNTDTNYVYLEKISKHFGSVNAVDNINLEIKKGEFLFLLGPSGCGKTTTLRIIAGFVKPDTGNVFINNQLMNPVPVSKRNLGMVFQNYALFPHLTVFENIIFGLRLRKAKKDAVDSKFKDMVRLARLDETFKDRYPTQLSGGQQQRVALARALSCSPDVLLLDEPFGALDRKLRKEMQVELRELQKTLGITTIFVTHDQEEALTMSDRIAVMEFGKIIQIDTPEGIYEKPRTKFIADFIGETNVFKGKVSEISQGILKIEIRDKMTIHAVAHRYNYEKGKEVYVAIRPEKVAFQYDRPLTSVNLFEGTITNVLYLGDKTHYYIRLTTGENIVACRQNTEINLSKDHYITGKKIFVCWNIENTLVLEG